MVPFNAAAAAAFIIGLTGISIPMVVAAPYDNMLQKREPLVPGLPEGSPDGIYIFGNHSDTGEMGWRFHGNDTSRINEHGAGIPWPSAPKRPSEHVGVGPSPSPSPANDDDAKLAARSPGVNCNGFTVVFADAEIGSLELELAFGNGLYVNSGVAVAVIAKSVAAFGCQYFGKDGFTFTGQATVNDENAIADRCGYAWNIYKSAGWVTHNGWATGYTSAYTGFC